jgi:hypothetical protein
MRQILIIAFILLCQSVNVSGANIILHGTSYPAGNIEKTYIADTDHIRNTPSWVVGDPCPLSRENLLILLHGKYPKLTNEYILSIEIKKASEKIKNKWYYIVWWMNNDGDSEWSVVLLDGTIIEPRITPYK